MQGILISSQNQSRHSNITVRNNLVLTNDMPLGIAVYASDGATITGNVVASSPRSKWETKLYVSNSTRTTVENNTTTRLVIDGKLRQGGKGKSGRAHV